jgi:NADH:ubiquinone oxidoreductase subunit F (NADH-binding)
MWIEVFIESDKVDVDAVQDEFYRHEDCNKITTCKKAVDAQKEKDRAQD